jgi:hypothetical protein
VNGVTPKPKRCQLQTLVKLREFIGRLLFGPPSLEHDGRAQITVTQTAERHAPGTSDPDTSLTDIDLRLSPGALSTRTVASSATRRARRISATTLDGPHADVGAALFQEPLDHHGIPASSSFVERPPYPAPRRSIAARRAHLPAWCDRLPQITPHGIARHSHLVLLPTPRPTNSRIIATNSPGHRYLPSRRYQHVPLELHGPLQLVGMLVFWSRFRDTLPIPSSQGSRGA